MECPVCKSSVPENAKFCPQCGAKISEGEGINPALLALAGQYERRLRENPKDTTTRFNLALTYIRMKRWGAAVQQLEIVRQQEPDFPDTWYLLAVAYKGLGQTEQARLVLSEFIRCFPDHPKASELRLGRQKGLDTSSSSSSKLLTQEGKEDEGVGEDEKSAWL